MGAARLISRTSLFLFMKAECLWPKFQQMLCKTAQDLKIYYMILSAPSYQSLKYAVFERVKRLIVVQKLLKIKDKPPYLS